MKSVALAAVVAFLDRLLDTASFEDASLNGLQLDCGKKEIKTAAFAVDAGEAVLTAAIEETADLLIVHHGMLWGGQAPLTGAFGRKVAACMNRGVGSPGTELEFAL